MADKQNKSGVLVRDKEHVKFVQLLRKAEKEGRLDGPHNCPICGMRFNTQEKASECCTETI